LEHLANELDDDDLDVDEDNENDKNDTLSNISSSSCISKGSTTRKLSKIEKKI
jgi:hypothetical protein